MKIITIHDLLVQNKNYIIERYNSGTSTNKLANEFSCNAGTIYLFLKENNVIIRNTHTPQDILTGYLPKIKELYSYGLSAYRISLELKIAKSTVLRLMKRFGMSTSSKNKLRNDPLKNHEQEIVDLYKTGLSTCQIAKQFSTGSGNIWQILQRNTIETRSKKKYSVNEEFFRKIDSEEKAYILGFWYADGNCTDRKTVRLQIADLEILEKIRNRLEFTGPISLIKRRYNHQLDQYCINIYSIKMFEDLCLLGCTPRKSLTLKFPTKTQVSQEFYTPLLRGYFDGDGGWSENYLLFTGNYDFLLGISKITKEKFNFDFNWYKKKSMKHEIYTIGLSSFDKVVPFANWLYANATIYLERKYHKYLEMLQRYEVWKSKITGV